MIIDTNFDFHSDSKGGDPDIYSPTLKKYHQILWNKPLPNGKLLELDKKTGAYIYHKSELGEFFLGSDAITNSYKHHKSKYWLTKGLEKDIEELYKAGATIGAYIIFPNKKINGMQTINQVRGINKFIDSNNYKKITVQGMEDCINFLNSLKDLRDKKIFVEINACKGSCLGGQLGKKQKQHITNVFLIWKKIFKKTFHTLLKLIAQEFLKIKRKKCSAGK